jgi:addiction module HigA family antidote
MRPVHPGEILREDFMSPLELSSRGLALALGVPGNRITEIVAGRRDLSADTALRLERYFGVSAQFWLNIQKTYELARARDSSGTRIAREVQPRAA